MTTTTAKMERMALWVQHVTADSALERPAAIITADAEAIRRHFVQIGLEVAHVPMIELHDDAGRGEPFQSPGEGPWRVSGVRRSWDVLETTERGPDRIHAVEEFVRALAAHVLPKPCWELAADATQGLLAVALASVHGRALAIGLSSGFGYAATSASMRLGVFLSSRPLPEKERPHA